MSDIFEKATRQALRFDLPNGQLSVEELWQLKPTKRNGKLVDDLADYEETLEEQLVKFSASTRRKRATKSAEQERLELQFEIVSYILNVREADQLAAKEAATKKLHNDKILSLIAKKQEDNLGELSVDELTAMLK